MNLTDFKFAYYIYIYIYIFGCRNKRIKKDVRMC